MPESEDTHALAVYGTLAPGESNHWVVSRIKGEWVDGTVRGHVFEISWGPAEGYEGFVADSEGSAVAVSVLLSTQLDQKWREIDDFEGAGYERRAIDVELTTGDVRQAQIYIALTDV